MKSGKDDKNRRCPLCGNMHDLSHVAGQDERLYLRCPVCELVFVDKGDVLPSDDEISRYLEHNNGIEFPGYVKFLYRAIKPALPFLEPGSRGLDFGCGHAPTLSKLLQNRGFECEDYDLYFKPDMPEGPFDFIFSTETFEHFTNPAVELKRIGSLLKPGGHLIIMTQLWHEESNFTTMFYFRDVSHYVFYHPKTIKWIAEKFAYNIVYWDGKRIVILEKAGNGEW